MTEVFLFFAFLAALLSTAARAQTTPYAQTMQEAKTSANGKDERRYLAVLFDHSTRPLISPQDVGAMMDWFQNEGMKSNGARFNLSECLRRREEWGVESCFGVTSCLNLKSFSIDNYHEANYHNTVSSLGNCSLLIHWLNDTGTETIYKTKDMSTLEVWSYGILSTAIISLSGISGALFYPFLKTGYFQEVMNFLMGLAFGSLSATSIIQLIPEAFDIKKYDNDYLLKTMFCWGSMWLFYFLGVIANISNGNIKHSHTTGNNVPNQDSAHLTPQTIQNGLEMTVSSSEETNTEDSTTFIDRKKSNTIKPEECQKKQKKISTAAMILFGDSLHNFVDGMSIGAGFTQSLGTGISIATGVACEEFPHELGDFAVLIKSGYSFKKALKVNFISACTIFLGLIVGILLGQIEASIYIYAFSGGLFLYISLGELVPELKEMIAEAKEKNTKSAIIAFSLQNMGIFTGALMLYLVSKYEGS